MKGGQGRQGRQGGQGRQMTLVETRFIASLPNAQCPNLNFVMKNTSNDNMGK
ncbi:hypothetical protein H6G33_26135 [Calothrix sp. FACHB-1219]|uniref:hypothetical protein n=1 Tax=unclassified Calothrix TaxID=2619626 RepID=UPI0016895D72|nr:MULTISPECIES: hypothetical protein [unclassified Calothrix]MBD2204182.1 hypothetical protein [Calothrix sp. FACHB-168]MBD2220488.1 hypothetical protein [Calothrix sp. FACHB-1219]